MVADNNVPTSGDIPIVSSGDASEKGIIDSDDMSNASSVSAVIPRKMSFSSTDIDGNNKHHSGPGSLIRIFNENGYSSNSITREEELALDEYVDTIEGWGNKAGKRRREVVSSDKLGVVMGYDIHAVDFLSFCNGQKLTDAAINSILKISESSYESPMNALVLDTNFFVLGFGAYDGTDFEVASEILRESGIDLKNVEQIIFPVNLNGLHWSIFEVISHSKSSVYMDSYNRVKQLKGKQRNET